MRTYRVWNLLGLFLVLTLMASPALAQQAWWDPVSPDPGDAVTIYYDQNEGSISTGTIKLHWGVNSWQQPPFGMWPPNTLPAGGGPVQTVMLDQGNGIWSLTIQTQVSTTQLDFVFTNGPLWDDHFGFDWHIYLGDPSPHPIFLSEEFTTVGDTRTLYGEVPEPNVTMALHHTWSTGSTQYDFGTVSGRFDYTAPLYDGDNDFYWVGTLNNETGQSSVLTIVKDVQQQPEAVMDVNEFGGIIYLDADQSWDPQGQDLDYLWTQEETNPQQVSIAGATTPHASFVVPPTAGTYVFELRLEDTDGNITVAQTLAEVFDGGGVDSFELWKSAQWIREAVVYEIYPRSYDPSSQLSAITNDMPRLQALGISAIWLMPIFEGPTWHGYAVTDYYSIEQDLGTLATFGDLVEAAHAHGIKVMLDMVINHTDVGHPWMQDAMEKGELSNAYDWYDRDGNGDYTYYYDWESLPNLNYANPDVRHYMIEMCKWWITEYDVDGFRCDAAWGVQSRWGQFWADWRYELKTLKPDIYLLAEATMSDWSILWDRFDSAMDWELYFDANGIEQLFSNSTPEGLHDRISNYGVDWPEHKFPFRFMENHDEDRYIAHKTPEQTKTAATLLLTIPGVPMMYAGQEVGEETMRDAIQWNGDTNNMYEHYETLLWARNNLRGMTGDYEWYLWNTSGDNVFSYARYWAGEPIPIMTLNLSGSFHYTVVPLPTASWGIDPGTTYTLTELFSGDHWQVTGADMVQLETGLDPYQSKLFVLSDRVEGPGNISLSLVPESATTFPAGGGTLTYGAVITNHTEATLQRHAWTEVLLPNGNPYGPLLLTSVNLPEGTINPSGLTQNIPAMAPTGQYQFIATIGLYNPLNPEATDRFGFYKQGVATTGTAGWEASDWDPGSQMAVTAETTSEDSSLPTEFALEQAYPNPFNPSTTIRVALPEAADLNVTVYNVMGQAVTTLADGRINAGTYAFTFDASNLASGLYFVRATVPDQLEEVQKIMLVR
jgi:cyclomaltodextrinase / maltogenic alpha-amylase / neopullulanase